MLYGIHILRVVRC